MLSNTIYTQLKSIPTPFYLYDIPLLRRTIAAAKASADRRGYQIHYALKANPDKRLLGVIAASGLGADCVSGGEVRRAVECGFAPDKIVFEGVAKRDEDILYAINHNIYAINCESLEEVVVINSLAASVGKVAEIGLRLNPNIDSHTNEHLTTGRADCKFGISRRELRELLRLLPKLNNIHIRGVHFHIGSQILDMSVFEAQCHKAQQIVDNLREKKGLALEFVNMGGGLGIDYHNPEQNPIPDFEGYFATFEREFSLAEGMVMRFELGRSMVAQCGELVTRVMFTKTNESGRRFLIVDSGMSQLIRPALYGSHHEVRRLGDAEGREVYAVVGDVCESSDTFAYQTELPITQRGDMLSLLSAGAYGASMASCYNLHPLPAAHYWDGELEVTK